MKTGVGERLREERLRLKLNQVDFAALAGVTKTTQGNYEANKRSPDAGYLFSVSTAGVDVQYVITGQREVDKGVSIDAVKQAVEKAFTMVTAAKMTISPAQLAAMVIAFLPEPTAKVEASSQVAPPLPASHQIKGDGNMVASGHGITQVGGKQRIFRGRKMKSN